MISFKKKVTSQQWYKKISLHSNWFAIYGLGSTGQSVINHFKKFGFDNYTVWDDSKIFNKEYSLNKKEFSNSLDFVDYIVISPGINIDKAKLKKKLKKNKHKIITDLDLFYILNPGITSIVITGSNGKSTTCKILEHLLKKNKIKTELAGNIGTPVLNLQTKDQRLVLIEASSFQLAYSKFIKPTIAMILNISNDHLDWHGNMSNYINSKFKIFELQNNQDFAILKNPSLINNFKKLKNKSRLKIVDLKSYKNLEKKIKNLYLRSQVNQENMSFVYEISKILKITERSFVKSMNSFKGLPHRHELFYRKKNIKFINDSKATTFESCKNAIKSNKNIYWILGGQPKLKDKIVIDKSELNIVKAYIIGKNPNFFKNQIKKKIKFKEVKNLKLALQLIFRETHNLKNNLTVLLSPGAASYDQYKNFEERGLEFKKLVKEIWK